jgi:hypothetical protein
VQTTDVSGASTRSALHLIAFRDWIVEQIGREPGRRFVNLAGAGVLHGPGIEPANLDEILDGRPDIDIHATLAAAHTASRQNAGVDVASVAETVARDMEAGGEPPNSLLGRWLAFAGGTVASSDIVTALRGVPSRVPAVDSDQRLQRCLPAPFEAQDRLRDLLGSASLSQLAGSDADALPEPTADALRCVATMIRRLLSEPRALVRGFDRLAGEGLTPSGPIPASHGFDWEPFALRLVRAVERETTDRLVAPDIEADAGAPSYWTDAVEPLGESVVYTTHASADRQARIALASQFVLLLLRFARPTADTPSNPDARRVARAMWGVARELLATAPIGARGGQTVRCAVSISGGSDDDPATCRVEGTLAATNIMRVLTGMLVRNDQAAGEPVLNLSLAFPVDTDTLRVAMRLGAGPDDEHEVRARFFTRPSGWLEPVLLTDRGVPPSIYGASLADGRVLLTPIAGRCSVAIDERGEPTNRESWPRPINGERPWGDSGGAVAWSNARGSACVLHRPAAGAPATTMDVDFTPSGGLVTPDGLVYWAATSGGLWQWRPGESVRCVADTPPVFGIRQEADGAFRLDPWAHDEHGFTTRHLTGEAWIWRPDTGRLDRRPLDPDGPGWSETRAGEWRAEACPHADTVRFRHADGTRVRLACYFPVTVGWAGRSLIVVSSTAGDVLLFANLLDELERIRITRR